MMNHHRIVIHNVNNFHDVSWTDVHRTVCNPMLHTPVLIAIVGDCQVLLQSSWKSTVHVHVVVVVCVGCGNWPCCGCLRVLSERVVFACVRSSWKMER